MSDHDGFKSSRLDVYSKLGVVAVYIQTGPLEAFVAARKWYRKFSVVLNFSVLYTAQMYLVTVALAQDDLPGRRSTSSELHVISLSRREQFT